MPRLAPLIALAACALLTLAAATKGDGPPVEGAEPRVRKLGPHLYAVGAVRIDAEERTVRCPGRVNMDESGPIELLACLPRGKTHESVFTLDVEPMDLQIALLLLDLEPGRNPAVDYHEEDPDGALPPGDEVEVFIEWQPEAEEDGAEPEIRRDRGEAFLLNVQTEQAPEEATWVFMGSRMVEGRFGADFDGTLITTYHDPLAVLELALPTANDDIYYHVNAEVCPPVGTPVELIIHAPEPEEENETE